MSIRVIVEFNNDYWHQIKDHPAEFAETMRLALADPNGADDRRDYELRRFGVRIITSRHHTDKATITVGSWTKEIG